MFTARKLLAATAVWINKPNLLALPKESIYEYTSCKPTFCLRGLSKK